MAAQRITLPGNQPGDSTNEKERSSERPAQRAPRPSPTKTDSVPPTGIGSASPESRERRVDSEAPKSGVRLVSPGLAPRPRSEPPRPPPLPKRPISQRPLALEEPSAPSIPPLPLSRRAAVKPRIPRGATLPPAPSQPRLASGAAVTLPANRPNARAQTPSSPPPRPVRSLIATAQDWPRIPTPVPAAPSFGGIRGPLLSLPAFHPPPNFATSPLAVSSHEALLLAAIDAESLEAEVFDAITSDDLIGEPTLAIVLPPVEPAIVVAPVILAPIVAAPSNEVSSPAIDDVDELALAMRSQRLRVIMVVAVLSSLALAFVLGLALSR